MPKGTFFIDASLGVDLSSAGSASLVGKPISLSPDLWYGVTDDITVGLVHSFQGETGLLGFPNRALCLTGTSNGCSDFYDNVGADVRYRLKAPLSLDAGLYVDSFSSPNFQMGVKLGIDGRWRFGKIAVEVQPNLFIMLTNRESGSSGVVTVEGNEERLAIPVTGSYSITPAFDLELQVGLLLPFDQAGDFFAIPLSIAARYAVNPKLSVGLVFTLPQLAGGSALDTGADFRTLTLGGSYAL